MENLYFCTIGSKNRLAHVKVLAESLATHHPEARIFFLLVDKIENFFDPLSLEKNIELIAASTLGNVPNITELFFKYTAFEASTALKPYFCEYLLKTYNIKKLIYLDSDIYVTENMGELNGLLKKFSLILTPHITKELPLDAYLPNELAFLKAGTFNTGFIGISNTSEALKFLSWWEKRLWHFCLAKPADGMSDDQRWVDLVPSLFDKVHILKEPEYNVAYWNLHERKLSVTDGKVIANGELMRFFHFSGFDPGDIDSISKYQTRYRLIQFPKLRTLFELYKKLLTENGYDTVCTWPYSYNFFDNGRTISDRARKIYWLLGNNNKKFGNPFETDKKNAFKKYYSRNFPKAYEYLDKIVDVGKRHKIFFRRFPRLEVQARKVYAFLKFLVAAKVFVFFIKK